MVDTADVVAALARVLRATEETQGELDALDAIVGDGDHGVTMVIAWRAVNEALKATPPASPGAALRSAAESFAGVGGSAGPLWGTALLRAGRALGDAAQVDSTALTAAAQAALEGMKARGRCAEGDGTVVDALAPAVRTLAAGNDLREAALAAAVAAAATATVEPRRGRAARAAERARGHVDAGAKACAVFWSAIADCDSSSPQGDCLVSRDGDSGIKT